MKTIIHLVLSDSERNDLARRIERADTKRLVTRNEIIEYVFNLIAQEIVDGRDADYTDSVGGEVHPDLGVPSGDSGVPPRDHPTGERTHIEDEDLGCSDETPDYLTSPSAAGLTDACRDVLEHIRAGEKGGSLNLGWCAGRLLQEGIQ